MKRVAWTLAVACAGLPAEAREEARMEKALAAFVDEHTETAIELLGRVVNINSGTMNPEGVRTVGAVFRPEFESLGFDVRWVPGEAFGRAGHLVAERTGQGPRILLIGHLDTVFEADSPFQHFEREGWIARGPGALDMKGGDVVLLLALRALAAVGALQEMSVSVILTGDEEATGSPLEEARRELTAIAKASDFAIGFEDGDGDPRTAVIARRGSSSWRIETRGVRAHSSQIHQPEVGSGAIFEAARMLMVLHGLREPELSMSPGLVLGGTQIEHDQERDRGTAYGKENVVAERAIITGDLRPLSLAQRKSVKARIQAAVEEALSQTSSVVTFRDSYPPMEPSQANRRLLSILDRASRDLGQEGVAPADVRKLGAADVSFAAPHVRAAIDGLGLGGEGGHTTHEQADLRTLPLQAKRAALLILRLSRGAFDAP